MVYKFIILSSILISTIWGQDLVVKPEASTSKPSAFYFKKYEDMYLLLAVKGTFSLDDNSYYLDTKNNKKKITRYFIKVQSSCDKLFHGLLTCSTGDQPMETIYLIDFGEPTSLYVALDFDKCFQDQENYFQLKKQDLTKRVGNFDELEIAPLEKSLIARLIISRMELFSNLDRQLDKPELFLRLGQNKLNHLFLKLIAQIVNDKISSNLTRFNEIQFKRLTKALRKQMRQYMLVSKNSENTNSNNDQASASQIKSRNNFPTSADTNIPMENYFEVKTNKLSTEQTLAPRVKDFEKKLLMLYVFINSRFVYFPDDLKRILKFYISDFLVSRKEYMIFKEKDDHVSEKPENLLSCKHNNPVPSALDNLFPSYLDYYEEKEMDIFEDNNNPPKAKKADKAGKENKEAPAGSAQESTEE